MALGIIKQVIVIVREVAVAVATDVVVVVDSGMVDEAIIVVVDLVKVIGGAYAVAFSKSVVVITRVTV